MLRRLNDLEGHAINATDGAIGHVTDFYFDDKAWVIRYLIVDTGAWLAGRKVLISPVAIGSNWTEDILPVSLTKEQVKNSPEIDTEKPVSREHEIRHHEYYGYPFYWDGAGAWGGSPWGGGIYPSQRAPDYTGLVSMLSTIPSEADKVHVHAGEGRHQDEDPNLRSCKAIMSYHVRATDGGDVGHIAGLLVDEGSWAIRHIIVDTSGWWHGGHQVLVSPQWIKNVSWSDMAVFINLTRQAMKDIPEYNAAMQLN